MSQTPMKQAGPARPSWYTIKQQRVKYANFWVKKDRVIDRSGPSWTTPKLSRLRSEQAEPWNVENVRFSGDGIRVIQYAANYDFSNEKPGGKVLTEDELSWSVLFKPNSMRNICVRELKIGSNEKRKRLSTVIELCFEYEGLPESKDSTRFMIREEGEISEHDEEVAGEETGGEDAEEEPVHDEDMEEAEAEAVEEEEEEEEVEEEVLLKPDQFDLAKLFAGPNDLKNLEVRIAFLRSPAKLKPWRWQWPAVVNFLRGMEGYTPQVKKPEMEYQFGLPLDEWMSKYGNKHSQRFIPQRQDDGTTKWTVRYIFNQHMRMVWDSNDLFSSGMQQQLPLRPSTAVPAHGTPLSRAAQPPHQSPASAQPTPTPAPTSSEPSNGPKRRTLEEIDAEEEEMDRQVAARREGFREERRRLFEEGSGAF